MSIADEVPYISWDLQLELVNTNQRIKQYDHKLQELDRDYETALTYAHAHLIKQFIERQELELMRQLHKKEQLEWRT